MDPQATWELLLDAYSDHDWDAVDEHASVQLAWLEKGGFPPQTVQHRELRPPVNRLIARATCRLALDERRVCIGDAESNDADMPRWFALRLLQRPPHVQRVGRFHKQTLVADRSARDPIEPEPLQARFTVARRASALALSLLWPSLP